MTPRLSRMNWLLQKLALSCHAYISKPHILSIFSSHLWIPCFGLIILSPFYKQKGRTCFGVPTLCTPSQYALGVVHDCVMLWKQSKSPTKNGTQITGLLEALPKELKILKIESHNSSYTPEIKGNSLCDKYITIAASQETLPQSPAYFPLLNLL